MTIRCLVIGNCCVDRVLVGDASRTGGQHRLDVRGERASLGGAGYVASSLASRDVDVVLTCAMPNDGEEREFVQDWSNSAGIGSVVAAATTKRLPGRTRFLGADGLHLLADGDLGSALPAEPDVSLPGVQFDVAVVADYGARASGWLTPEVLQSLTAHEPRALIEQLHRSRLHPMASDVMADALKVIVVSAGDLIEGFDTARHVAELSRELQRLAAYARREVVVVASAGSDGLLVRLANRDHLVWLPPTLPLEIADPTGAGDLLVASIAARLGGAFSGPEALVDCFESAQADTFRSLVSREPGAVPIGMPSTRAEVATVVVGGCFDPLHSAHVALLETASRLGCVVVAVNSDTSVRQLKGPERPLLPLADRVAVLRALRCVDEVVAFDELTPDALLRRIRPTVFVKGNDYTMDLPEARLMQDLGGVAIAIRGAESRSSTALLRKLVARQSSAG